MESFNRDRILIYGGGFNPPTLAHVEVIKLALKLPEFSQVWVMPCGNRLDKQFAISDDTRLEMLKLVKQEMFNSDPRLQITDFELKLSAPTNTASTLEALELAYTNLKFAFLFGVDSYNQMPSWENGQRLQSELDMVIVNRGNLKLPTRAGITHLKITDTGISSTLVRELAGLGLPIDLMVCPAIDNIIKANGLYGGSIGISPTQYT